MPRASLNSQVSRWAVTGFAATVLAIIALAAAFAPAAFANLDPAPDVSQESTELPDVLSDLAATNDQDGGTDVGDGLADMDEDPMLVGAQGLVDTDPTLEGLSDGGSPSDGGDLAFVGDDQRYRQQYQQSMSPKPPPTPAKPTTYIDCQQIVSVAELFQCSKAPQKENVLLVELSIGAPSKLKDSLAAKINALTGKKNVVKIVVGCKVNQVDELEGNYVVTCTPISLGLRFKADIGVDVGVTGIDKIVLPVQLRK